MRSEKCGLVSKPPQPPPPQFCLTGQIEVSIYCFSTKMRMDYTLNLIPGKFRYATSHPCVECGLRIAHHPRIIPWAQLRSKAGFSRVTVHAEYQKI